MRAVWRLLGILLVVRGVFGLVGMMVLLVSGVFDAFVALQVLFSAVLVVVGVLLIRGRPAQEVIDEA